MLMPQSYAFSAYWLKQQNVEADCLIKAPIWENLLQFYTNRKETHYIKNRIILANLFPHGLLSSLCNVVPSYTHT